MSRTPSSHPDVIVVSEAGQPRFALEYFFSVFFGYRVQFVSDLRDVHPVLAVSPGAKLIVVTLADSTERTCRLIEAVASTHPKPFIFALIDDPASDAVIKVFQANADDVVRSPMSLTELAYRLRARSAEIGLSFSFLLEQLRRFDIAADIVQRADLTDIEAQIIYVLLHHHGMTVSREDLSREIDKTSWNYGNRKFDVHISHIRRKLEKTFKGALAVRTERAKGYALILSP